MRISFGAKLFSKFSTVLESFFAVRRSIWLVAGRLVCCRSFLRAPEFSKPGKEVFEEGDESKLPSLLLTLEERVLTVTKVY